MNTAGTIGTGCVCHLLQGAHILGAGTGGILIECNIMAVVIQRVRDFE